MAEIKKSFEALQQELVEAFREKPELIDEAKELFTWIESNRQLSLIRSIGELLTLLQRKGHWEADKVATLKWFKKLVQSSQFDDLVEQHLQLLQAGKFEKKIRNKYAEKRTRVNRDGNTSNEAGENIPHQSIIKNPMEKREQIYVIIARGLDFTEARSLARFLKIPENEIKNIEIKYGDSRTMTFLSVYEQRTSRDSVKKLTKVLEILRRGLARHDLAEKIERLFKN